MTVAIVFLPALLNLLDRSGWSMRRHQPAQAATPAKSS
jgi:hypothetical protein